MVIRIAGQSFQELDQVHDFVSRQLQWLDGRVQVWVAIATFIVEFDHVPQ